jgi:signal recognition particle GTPase
VVTLESSLLIKTQNKGVLMLQKVIMDQFQKKFSNPTYKEMVELTGIEQTRLFRIKNGTAMRLEEFEKILKLMSETSNPMNLFFDCYKYLDQKTLSEVEQSISRKIALAKLRSN